MVKKIENKFNYDKFAAALIEKLSERRDKDFVSKTPPLKGSLGEKDSFVMPEPLQESNKPYFGTERSNNELFALLKGKRKLGFIKNDLKSFERLTKEVHAVHENKISYSKIHDLCFEWIIVSKIEIENIGKISTDFSVFIDNHLVGLFKDYDISFKILNIEIAKSFNINEVKFWYVPKNYWSEKSKQNGIQKDVHLLDKKFEGSVFVGCTIKGKESEKAKEEAYKKCCYAVDLLKILYHSFIPPHQPIYFEIDNRCKYHQNGIGLLEEINSNTPAITLNNNIKDGLLSEETIDWITAPERSLLCETINDLEATTNELRNLVVDSIQRFSNALSIENIHGKIVSLMTIWEALLLPNSKAPIRHTLVLYGPKLIYDSLEDRRKLADLIKSFYEKRSDYLHHSIKSEIEPEDTFEFQKNTLNLIIVMLNASKKYKTKQQLLNIIDEEVEKSFSIMKVLSI